MKRNLSPAMDIMGAVEATRKEGFAKVIELLPLDPASPIAGILSDQGGMFNQAALCDMLGNVAAILKEHAVERRVTDWPYENFWRNPNEPAHSKLLGYFINPSEGLPCARLLLNKFLKVLGEAVGDSNFFPGTSQGWVVKPETRDEFGQIDLWIFNPCDASKYAIIIENKINRAPNQRDQLQRYVKRAHDHGFRGGNEIFVFFLPLTDTEVLDPAPSDLEAIQGKAEYRKISFETHIRGWLEAVDREWPSHLDERIREHMKYYRNLIDFLIKQRKQETMANQILIQLKRAAENGKLPCWSDVEMLVKSADELQRCFKGVLCGKLLLEIQKLLHLEGIDSWFSSDISALAHRITASDPYDECFQDWRGINVCIAADHGVVVRFGCNTANEFWYGFGFEEPNEPQFERVEPVARRLFKSELGKGAGWYAWAFDKNTVFHAEPLSFSDCEGTSAAVRVKESMLEMRKKLMEQPA